ncbi:MAG: hypothetical protein ABI639_09150 [Thermoanaerobaculia bacterium]
MKDVLQTLAEHGMAVQGSPDLYGWVLTLEGKTYRVFYKFDDTTVYLLGLGPAISSTFQ